jgi:Zn-dependent peptidase ImmA (M78 family)/DNA-binding XRE family transcriptional regulator
VIGMFSAARFEVARKRRGLTKSELAGQIGVDLRAVTAYERGEYEPSVDTLTQIAGVLDFPIGWFSGGDLHQPLPQTASFRSQARMAAGHRDAALASGALAFLLNDWLDSRFTLPVPDLADLREEEPEPAAITLRQHWGLGERPIKNVVHLLESKGVRVFSMAEDTTEVDAFSLWRETTPFVFLNTMKSAERSRFDAAHELGHLVLHRHADPKGKEVEHQANSFASAFLMPRGSILGHVPVLPSLNALIKLKKNWIVSVAALAYRLHQLAALTDWHYRSLCIEMGQRGYRTNEPDEAPREMSLVFPQLFKALREDKVTRADISGELQINVEELDKLVFGLMLVVLDGGNPSGAGNSKANLRLVK